MFTGDDFKISAKASSTLGKPADLVRSDTALAGEGWAVFRLNNSETMLAAFPAAEGKTLYLVDDAHLAPAASLRAAEEFAGPDRFVLSVHNAIGHEVSVRGTVTIERKKAVRTIAAGLLKDPHTFSVVRRIDDQVGDLPGEFDLRQRIEHAEAAADYPWQFCFILGGGWRRAQQSADAARASGADLMLAAIAIHQLVSRDARPSSSEIVALATAGDLGGGLHPICSELARPRAVGDWTAMTFAAPINDLPPLC